MHNETAAEIAEAEALYHQRLVDEALSIGCQLLPDAILPLADTFCGCGNPEVAWAWIRDYLENLECCRAAPLGAEGPMQPLWPTPLCRPTMREPSTGPEWLAVYLLDHLQLTEHCTSIRGAWLTEAGHEVLAFLREHGPDWSDGKWIGSDGTWRGSID